MTRHMQALGRPICEQVSAVKAVGHATFQIYCVVDCTACLRRSIAESEERLRVLHELLVKATAT